MRDLESLADSPGSEAEPTLIFRSGLCRRRRSAVQATAPPEAAPHGLAVYVQQELRLAREHLETYPSGSLGLRTISNRREALSCWSQEKAKRHLSELRRLCTAPSWASLVGEPWKRHGWDMNNVAPSRLSFRGHLLRFFGKGSTANAVMTGDDFVSVFAELSALIGQPNDDISDLTCLDDSRLDSLKVVDMSGDLMIVLENKLLGDMSVSDLKERICHARGISAGLQTLITDTGVLDNVQSLAGFAGCVLTLVKMKCPCPGETCLCHICHGMGGGPEPNNPWCPCCGRVETKTRHHDWHMSQYASCLQCGSMARKRAPCWGGATLVRLSNGTSKELSKIVVGDEVATVKGSRRVLCIHTTYACHSCHDAKEVCNFRGIWISSHHPILLGRDWFYPADVASAVSWCKVADLVPVLINLELEGHDDTIVLEGNDMPVISCTIGKYMGKRFGFGMSTRRSTRCSVPCVQCDAVYLPTFLQSFQPRWSRFPPFPQVEWDGADMSEFDCAELIFQTAIASGKGKATEGCALTMPEARPWKRAVLADLQCRLQAGTQQFTSQTMARLIEIHVSARRTAYTDNATSDFGLDPWLAKQHRALSDESCVCGLCGCCCEPNYLTPCVACKGTWCGSCLKVYVHAQIEVAPRGAPVIPCPGCKNRVPIATWQQLLGSEMIEHYGDVVKDLLAVRCSDCGNCFSMLSDACNSDDRPRLLYEVFGSADIPNAASRIWQRFSYGDVYPQEFLEEIRVLSCSDDLWQKLPPLIADAERRLSVHLAMLQIDPICTCHCGGITCYLCKTSPCLCTEPENDSGAFCPECAAPGGSCAASLCICGAYWERASEKRGGLRIPCQMEVGGRCKVNEANGVSVIM